MLNPDGSRPGYSFNPITGCLNNCPYCYARRLANTILYGLYVSNNNRADWSPETGDAEYIKAVSNPFYPRFWPEKLKEINQDPYKNFSESSHQRAYRGKRRSKPRGIFVSDMGDLFGMGVPEDWTRQVLDAIRDDPVDRFYLLTSQPQNLAKFSPFPANCWVGVSVTDAATFRRATFVLPDQNVDLSDITAKMKYLSIEPLLDWNDISSKVVRARLKEAGISWVIIGSVTKHPELPQPKIDWVREIVQACDQAGVKVWLKNSLLPLVLGQPWAFAKTAQYPEGHLRQDMPKGE